MQVGKLVHVILDNYATHKHPKVREWLTRHPRFTFHFTPTSCSWANAVEGCFAKLTRRRLNAAYSNRSSICRPPSIASSPRLGFRAAPSLRRERGGSRSRPLPGAIAESTTRRFPKVESP